MALEEVRHPIVEKHIESLGALESSFLWTFYTLRTSRPSVISVNQNSFLFPLTSAHDTCAGLRRHTMHRTRVSRPIGVNMSVLLPSKPGAHPAKRLPRTGAVANMTVSQGVGPPMGIIPHSTSENK